MLYKSIKEALDKKLKFQVYNGNDSLKYFFSNVRVNNIT